MIAQDLVQKFTFLYILTPPPTLRKKIEGGVIFGFKRFMNLTKQSLYLRKHHLIYQWMNTLRQGITADWQDFFCKIWLFAK